MTVKAGCIPKRRCAVSTSEPDRRPGIGLAADREPSLEPPDQIRSPLMDEQGWTIDIDAVGDPADTDERYDDQLDSVRACAGAVQRGGGR